MRLKKFEYSVNLTGDFRESLISILIAKKRISPFWEPHHKFRFYNKIFKIPAVEYMLLNKNNIYDAYDEYSDNFIRKFSTNNKKKLINNSKLSSLIKSKSLIKKIGIFPSQSSFCKSWPLDYWIKLSIELAHNDYRVNVYLETFEFFEEFKKISNHNMSIHCLSLYELTNHISKNELVISHDSFPLHLAFKNSIKSIGLFGPTDPKLFSPPDVKIIQSNNCIYQPCNNIDYCKNTEKIICMKNLHVNKITDYIYGLK